MTQSVELLLDEQAETAIRHEWVLLHTAGLPSEVRSTPSPSHRPHVTLWAGPQLAPEAEAGLAALVADLDLTVRIGAVLCFPRDPKSVVLVRQLVPSAELVALQQTMAAHCGALLGGHFGPGRWSPHVTLAHRMSTGQVGEALALLGAGGQPGAVETRITRARRWDGDQRQDWLITSD